MAERIFTVNENFDLPAPVSQRLAERLADPATTEGAAVLEAVAPKLDKAEAASTYATYAARGRADRLGTLAGTASVKSAAAAAIQYTDPEELAVTLWGTDDSAFTGTSPSLGGTTTLRRIDTNDATPYRSAPITPPTVAGAFTIDATISNVGGGSGANVAALVGAANQAGVDLALTDLVGIGFDEAGYAVYTNAKISGSSTPIRISGSALPTGVYKATVHADATSIGMTIGVASDHRNEYAVRIDRATFNPNKVFAWFGDSRLASGSGVQQIGYKAGVGSRRSGKAEKIGDKVFYTKGPTTGDPLRVIVPKDHDSRKQAPLVIYGHGSGEDPFTQWGNTSHNPVKQGLVNRGAIFAQSNMGGTASWNSDLSRAALMDTYKYVRDRWHIGPVFLLGISMGGIATLDLLADDKIPGIVGWYGIQPTASLAAMYGINPTPIESALGFSGSANYAAATAGRDPLITAMNEPWRFRSVPMRAAASPGDTVAVKATNIDPLREALLPYVPEFTVLSKTGNHGDPSMYDAADVLAFFDRCIGAA